MAQPPWGAEVSLAPGHKAEPAVPQVPERRHEVRRRAAAETPSAGRGLREDS